MSIRTILVPMSFDDVSRRALDHAVELARSLGATLHLVSVVDWPALAAPEAFVVEPNLMADMEKSADEELRRMAQEIQGVHVQTSLRTGSAAHEIVAAAKDLGVDLIVMGTHGRRGISHALLGSVAEKVVRTAEVPVLTVGSRARAAQRAA